MILTRGEILELVRTGLLKISPFDEELVRENGVDLRLGATFCRLRRRIGVFDTRSPPANMEEEWYSCVDVGDEGFVIEPYDRVLAHTMEWLELPSNVVGLVNIRSTFARLGLSVPPTVVDAGFRGQLVIEILGSAFPVRVYPGQPFIHLVLVEARGRARYGGRYQGQRGVVLPKLVPERGGGSGEEG